MVLQSIISTIGLISFLVLSGKVIFSIPQVGVLYGLGLLLSVFLFWYFVLCHDFFKGGAVDFFNKFAGFIFSVSFLILVLLGTLKIIPWFP
jgi:hypothetical protein